MLLLLLALLTRESGAQVQAELMKLALVSYVPESHVTHSSLDLGWEEIGVTSAAGEAGE